MKSITVRPAALNYGRLDGVKEAQMFRPFVSPIVRLTVIAWIALLVPAAGAQSPPAVAEFNESTVDFREIVGDILLNKSEEIVSSRADRLEQGQPRTSAPKTSGAPPLSGLKPTTRFSIEKALSVRKMSRYNLLSQVLTEESKKLPSLEEFTVTAEGEKTLLVVEVQLRNSTDQPKIPYFGPTTRPFSTDEADEGAVLTDSNDVKYKLRAQAGDIIMVVGGSKEQIFAPGRATIKPRESCRAVLVFEVPTTAQGFKLHIDRSHLALPAVRQTQGQNQSNLRSKAETQKGDKSNIPDQYRVTITGRLLDKNNSPIAGLWVILSEASVTNTKEGEKISTTIKTGADGKLANPTATTDSEGRFTIVADRRFWQETGKFILKGGFLPGTATNAGDLQGPNGTPLLITIDPNTKKFDLGDILVKSKD